tara:strand:- start:4007 stop:5323 length:1317 start_codon:yes stop_codon:yes gene_type:complete
MKKNYVLDTNVLLTDHKCLFSYGNNDIIIPLKVLDEIDNHKKRQDGVGLNARAVIRTLDKFRSRGSLHKGIRIASRKGIIKVCGFDAFDLPEELDYGDADNNIIATAISVNRKDPRRKVIVVTRDINMRVKCDALGLLSEDYVSGKVVKHHEKLYTGYARNLVDDEVIDQFYNNEEVYIEKIGKGPDLCPNHFVMLISNSNDKKTALAIFDSYNKPLRKLKEFKKGPWGLKPRNKEQKFALNLLMDPSIPVVSLVGKAGSGKTLMAIAAGLQQVLDDETAIYKKLVVSRPIQPMGKDIGFLPGTLEEKMNPWLAPIQDNLEWLMGDQTALGTYVDRGIIQIEALTYIRGRSIADAFMIIDEAQNLTYHELKTIMTRVGENTKLVLTGDVQQIDNVYLDGTNNGLSYAVEKFKGHELSGHITLVKGERSKVATLAADIL